MRTRTYTCNVPGTTPEKGVYCGEQFTSARSNVKRCPACRLYDSLAYIIRAKGKAFTQDCDLCEAKFAPLSLGRGGKPDDHVCGSDECAVPLGHAVKGTCGYCKQQATVWHPNVSVCLPCLKSPANRPKLLKSLRNKRHELAAKNGLAPATPKPTTDTTLAGSGATPSLESWTHGSATSSKPAMEAGWTAHPPMAGEGKHAWVQRLKDIGFFVPDPPGFPVKVAI